MSCDTCFMGHWGRKIRWWHFIFKFDLRKGQLHVKLGPIRSNFKIKQISTNSDYILCSFISGFQTCHVFLFTTIINPKYVVSKMWRHHLYLFFGHCTAKTKILLWNFVYVLFVGISITCIPILYITWKNLDFVGNYFWENEILDFGGQNREKSKIQISHFVGRPILKRLKFFDCVLLQNGTF